MAGQDRFSRRALLGGAGTVAAGLVLGRQLTGTRPAGAEPLSLPLPPWMALLGPTDPGPALAALGRTTLRQPDSLPFPDLPPGTDTLPGIEHLVVLVMENHSYDNILGVLPQRRAGGTLDGLSRSPAAVTPWNPAGVTATNPTASGGVQHAFRMPGTTQLAGKPSQEWEQSHLQYAGGALDGFVTSASGPVAMGYYDRTLLPFTYSLADAFPVADRWFCSVLGQTDPNRRYIIAGTSAGMTDDIALPTSLPALAGTSPGTLEQDALLALPANGTIFDRMSTFGISWCDYTASYPTGTTAELFPLDDALPTAANAKPLADFFSDCATGALPAFSFVDPNYSTQSQEDPQDMAVGEALLAQVVTGVTSSPAWARTLLLITYDEHGGYYDHVAPPVALPPDAIPPVVAPGESVYDGFARYGFRVPAVAVSPYAVPGGVTHLLHDHGSIIATVARKWNLPACTYRDANANDCTDFLDMAALAARRPTIPDPPALAAPGPSVPLGAVPPPGSFGPG